MTKDYIVLVHGLASISLSMIRLAKKFKQLGYEIVLVDYPSTKHPIEKLADVHLHDELTKHCADPHKKIHFITHSMGGIIVRHYLAHHSLPNLGRVVMLAPPNRGSNVSDLVKNSDLINRLLGPALKQLGRKNNDFLEKLPPPEYEVGIIVGKYDVKVPPEQAKLDSASFLETKNNHTTIIFSNTVAEAAQKFIETGTF